MYWWPEMKLTAGWISSTAFDGSDAVESISAQIGQRFRVCASITTIGAFPFLYWPMSLIGTAPMARTSAAVSMPGILTRIAEPGLKPSEAL